MSYYRMKNLKMALDHGAIAKFSTGPLNLRAWEALYENTRKKISLLLAQISIFWLGDYDFTSEQPFTIAEYITNVVLQKFFS